MGEVSDDSDSTDGLFGSHSELYLFQGFSCPEESREASLNWRRILVLRQTASVILAGALRSAVLDDPARARRSSSHEISPACSAEAVGLHVDQSKIVEWSQEIRQDLDWCLDRDRLELGISLEQVSPQLELWSDASAGLGGSLGQKCFFRPLGSRRSRALDQRQGAPGRRESSPVVFSTTRRVFSGNFRRQFHGHCLPKELRRYSLFSSELHHSENSPLGGESSGCDFPTIHYGETQRARGFIVLPKSNSGFQMDSKAGGLSGSVQEVAGIDRPVRNIIKSPMFDIFFSLPRSQRSGNGCSSSELG